MCVDKSVCRKITQEQLFPDISILADQTKKTSRQLAEKVDEIADRSLDDSVKQGLTWGIVSGLTFLFLCPLSLGPWAPAVGITAAVISGAVEYSKSFKDCVDPHHKELHDTTKRA